MPADRSLKNSGSSAAWPVRVFVRRDGRKLTRAVFTPDVPRILGVLVENGSPRFYDLRRAEGPDAVREVNRGETKQLPVLLDDEFLVPTKFGDLVASDIAFRPEGTGLCAEAAVALGATDDVVLRFDVLNLKRRTPLDFENACTLAYSADGSLLAAGSTTGLVAVYNLLGDEPEILGGEVNVGGPVVSLCFERDNKQLRVATDNNTFGRVHLSNFDSGYWEQSAFDIDDKPEVTALNLHQIAYSPQYGLLAFGGTGPEIWVFNPEYGQGKLITSFAQTRVRQLQFVDDRDELVILGEKGIEVIGFERNCFELPEAPRWRASFEPQGEQSIIGFHQYGKAILVASPDPQF